MKIGKKMSKNQMYKQVCAEKGCNTILSINTHIFIMTREYEDSDGSNDVFPFVIKGVEEKTICEDCFQDYTPDNHNGWYDDEGQLKEEILRCLKP